LLGSDKFQGWLNHSKQTLFCQGIPGAGKTIMTSIVIDHLYAKYKTDASIGIAYLYFNFRQQHRRSDLLASLLKQLVRQRSFIPKTLQTLYQDHNKKQTRPSSDEITEILQSVIGDFQRVFIIIDALDEFQVSDGGRTTFLSGILGLQAKTGANIFATSRFVPEIAKMFQRSILLQIRADNSDVQRYLTGYMSQLPSFVLSDLHLQHEIKNTIANTVDGMYVRCSHSMENNL
jgi:predicted ATPase